MKKSLKAVFKFVDTVSCRAGDMMSILIVIIMLCTTIEVISRYVFNSPTIWVWPVNRQIFGVYILFAGIYAMAKNAHIRIEVVYNRFTKKGRKIAELFALLSFVCFIAVLIWQSAWMGQNSFMMKETAHGAFRIPLYPLKLLIPITAVLFLLEGIYVLLKKQTHNLE